MIAPVFTVSTSTTGGGAAPRRAPGPPPGPHRVEAGALKLAKYSPTTGSSRVGLLVGYHTP
jgi:hypothetical protein